MPSPHGKRADQSLRYLRKQRDARKYLLTALGRIRLAQYALALVNFELGDDPADDRCDRHHIDPADNRRAFAVLAGEADLEISRRAAATLGDQLIRTGRPAEGDPPCWRPRPTADSEEPT